ncbi:MAG TPA: PIN domain-containing protein [Actinomycetes bacterium]|nr:PIN domain-containing protein [Actinomycetes bacterium]
MDVAARFTSKGQALGLHAGDQVVSAWRVAVPSWPVPPACSTSPVPSACPPASGGSLGRGAPPGPRRAGAPSGVRLRRHQATAEELLLADLVVAEVVYVLESFFEVPRARVAALTRAVIAFPTIVVLDAPALLRALEIYELDRLDFAEAYLVAQAERSGVGMVASFDRAIDRVTTVRRVEPV